MYHNNFLPKKTKLVWDKVALLKRLVLVFSLGIFIFIVWYFFPRSIEETDSAGNKKLISGKARYEYPGRIYPQGVSLVFFADEYPNWEEFDADVSSLTEELKKIKPWKDYQFFNVYKIQPRGAKSICSVRTEDERKPVLSCQEKINDYLKETGATRIKLVVLSRRDFQSWANVSRFKNSGIFFSVPQNLRNTDQTGYGYLFAHLMGHSFGLKDEEKYVLAKAGGAPHTPDGPNCAPNRETAEKWWGDLVTEGGPVGYFQTCCGRDDYIRPMTSSLMNFNDMSSFNPTYGPVSERYLEKVLKYCFSEKKYRAEDDQAFFDQYPEFRECLEK